MGRGEYRCRVSVSGRVQAADTSRRYPRQRKKKLLHRVLMRLFHNVTMRRSKASAPFSTLHDERTTLARRRGALKAAMPAEDPKGSAIFSRYKASLALQRDVVIDANEGAEVVLDCLDDENTSERPLNPKCPPLLRFIHSPPHLHRLLKTCKVFRLNLQEMHFHPLSCGASLLRGGKLKF